MAVGDNEGELRNNNEMMILDGEHGRKSIKKGNDDDDEFDEKHEGIDEAGILNNDNVKKDLDNDIKVVADSKGIDRKAEMLDKKPDILDDVGGSMEDHQEKHFVGNMKMQRNYQTMNVADEAQMKSIERFSKQHKSDNDFKRRNRKGGDEYEGKILDDVDRNSDRNRNRKDSLAFQDDVPQEKGQRESKRVRIPFKLIRRRPNLQETRKMLSQEILEKRKSEEIKHANLNVPSKGVRNERLLGKTSSLSSGSNLGSDHMKSPTKDEKYKPRPFRIVYYHPKHYYYYPFLPDLDLPKEIAPVIESAPIIKSAPVFEASSAKRK